jgi:hypothetical protein
MPAAVEIAARRVSHGAFHNHVRAVFAQRSPRSRLLCARRASWLHQLSQQFVARVIAMNVYARD